MKETKELERYKEYLFQTELAQGTISIYIRQAKNLINYFQKMKITKANMIAYKKYLQGLNHKASTVNLHIIAANRYLKYLGYEKCLIKTERIQKKHCMENLLSMEEYQSILAYAKKSGREKYYFIMRVFAFTGIRVSELAFLTVEALDRGKFIVENKGKIREVYIPNRLVQELKIYCEKSEIQKGKANNGYGQFF